MNNKLSKKRLTVTKLSKVHGNGGIWRDTKAGTTVSNGCTTESTDMYYDANGDGKMNNKEYQTILICSSVDCGEL